MNKNTDVSSEEQMAAMIRELESGVECNMRELVISMSLSVDHHIADFSKLIRALLNKPTLESLCVDSGNGISFENITCIANLLDPNVNPLGRLRELVLESGVTDEKVVEICKGLNNNKFLLRLEFDGNEIGDAGAKCLGNVLATNHSLVLLDLRSNEIKDEGAEAIAEGIMQRQFPYHSNIARHFSTKPFKEFKMYLSGNDNISDLGAKAFASLLHKQHSALSPRVTLTTLSLHSCSVGDEGAMAIADSLKSCNTGIGLKMLYLYDNRIGNAGAIAFANAFKENKVLASLSLSANKIQLDGGVALCRTMEAYNDTLQILMIDGNPCSDLIWKNNMSIDSYLIYRERNHDKKIVTEYKQRVKAINIFKFIDSTGPYEMGQ